MIDCSILLSGSDKSIKNGIKETANKEQKILSSVIVLAVLCS